MLPWPAPVAAPDKVLVTWLSRNSSVPSTWGWTGLGVTGRKRRPLQLLRKEQRAGLWSETLPEKAANCKRVRGRILARLCLP